jgi:hypothetical protein
VAPSRPLNWYPFSPPPTAGCPYTGVTSPGYCTNRAHADRAEERRPQPMFNLKTATTAILTDDSASFLLFQLRWKRAEAKGEFASRILVSLPIAFHGFGHIPGGSAQPI